MIRWLHISDVHECKKDSYHREAMYEEIVAAVAARVPKPDLVFLTGDLAFSGAREEYRSFQDRFFRPLKAVLPDECPVFTVPGNHDVDRDAVVPPREWIGNEKQRTLFQDVGEAGRRKRREALLPRFDAYRAFEKSAASWNEDWLASERGSIRRKVVVGGKTLAIVGINTAWLCQDDHDAGKLTPGRTMLEASLRDSREPEPDLTIVLGHHPIDDIKGDGDWIDRKRVRLRLEQANAIYLHGHLHMADSQISGDVLNSVLMIQAPSGFQAADDKTWRNGIMWGQVDFAEGLLLVEPMRWNGDYQEYNFDTDFGPSGKLTEDRTAFRLPLPGRSKTSEGPRSAKERDESDAQAMPPGWRIVDRAALATITAERPDTRTMADYFDGSLPSWRVALAEGVRPRQIVDDVAGRFRAVHDGTPKPLVRLLTGAGDEGKSTALLQIAAALVRDETQSWTCLHREATAAGVPTNLFESLQPQEGHAWIVALDDAENVGAELAAALRHIAPRTDLHLILAARGADWQMRAFSYNLWHGVADFHQQSMPRLDEDDAKRIVEGWQAYGDDAMGLLHGQTTDDAARALFEQAGEQAARPGALLGALLIARQGEELRDRVRAFLAPLKGRHEIERFDLLNVYAMIAAMHAENQLYLSHTVLAFALGCESDTLDRQLRILRQEAMLDTGGTYLLTRQRVIAEAARDVLLDDDYDLRRWYPFLARAALHEFRKNNSGNPDIGKWTYGLPDYFVSRGESNWPVARAAAKAMFELEGNDPRLLVAYSKVLRQTKVPGEAMALLKAKAEPLKTVRGVLYEWSVAAGAIGDPGLNVWLAARSLADGGQPLSSKDCKLILAGLGRGFELLNEKTGQTAFKPAQAACGRLGLSLPDLDATSRRHFQRYVSVEADTARPEPTEDEDLRTLRDVAIVAADEVELDNDPEFFENLLGDPDSYRYAGLKRVIDGEVPAH